MHFLERVMKNLDGTHLEFQREVLGTRYGMTEEILDGRATSSSHLSSLPRTRLCVPSLLSRTWGWSRTRLGCWAGPERLALKASRVRTPQGWFGQLSLTSPLPNTLYLPFSRPWKWIHICPSNVHVYQSSWVFSGIYIPNGLLFAVWSSARIQ